MYIGRGLWYNKVVPLCDMAADSLSGGIVPMILKLRSRQMLVVRLSALATLMLEKKLELEAEWALELVWMFWKTDSYIAPAKICAQIFLCIFLSLY